MGNSPSQTPVGQLGRYGSQIMRELEIMGYPEPFLPRYVQPGPFIFTGTIPDNTVVPIDLTLQASFADDAQMALLLGANANDPNVLMYITAARIYFDFTGEPLDSVVMHQYRARLFLDHSANGDIRRLHPLFGDVVDDRNSVAATGTNATPVVFDSSNGESFTRFVYPWLVDLASDTFQLLPQVATNIAQAGGTPFKMALYGAAWQSQSLSAVDFRDVCGLPEKPDAHILKSMLQQRSNRR